MYSATLIVALVIFVDSSWATTDTHSLQINRTRIPLTSANLTKTFNPTGEQEKRTFLYLVTEKENNVGCIQTGSNVNSVINKCKSTYTKVLTTKSPAESSWSANNHETLNQNVKRSEDQYVALPSNQIGTTIELPRKKPAFQMVSVQKHRALLKSALLAKYPNQKNNIENLFSKIERNAASNNNSNLRVKVPLNVNVKFEEKAKKKRSKNYSNEIDSPVRNTLANNKELKQVTDQSSLTALLNKREAPSKNLEQSHYKITGKAVFPRFISGIDSNQPSGINIPYASNVNFDQRIFLLNKNPYYQGIGNEQTVQSEYPYRVSVYSLFNPDVATKNGISPAKYICIRESKDEEVGQKLFDMKQCVQLYNTGCSPNSKENCENLDGSIPIEFDERLNGIAKGMRVNNYVNEINRQVHLPQLQNQNLYNGAAFGGPYITTNQHVYYTPNGHSIHDTLFRNTYANQLYSHPLANNYLVCHLVDGDGIILDTKNCNGQNDYMMNVNQKNENKESKKQKNQSEVKGKKKEMEKGVHLSSTNLMKNESIHRMSSNISSISREANTTSIKHSNPEESVTKITNGSHSSATMIPMIKSDLNLSSHHSEISEKTKMHSETIVKEKNSNVQQHNLEHNLGSVQGRTTEVSHTTNLQNDLLQTTTPGKTHDIVYTSDSHKNKLKPTNEPLPTYQAPLTTENVIHDHSKTFKSVMENKTQQMKMNHSHSSNSTKTEFYQYPLPYNLTMLDLASFPCTRHLVQTNPPTWETTTKPAFKIKPILQNIIKQVVNDFVSKQTQTTEHAYKVSELEIESSSESYVAPEIIRTPVVKNLFHVPQVENLLFENVNQVLRNVSDLSEYISTQSITENLIRSQIKDFVDHIPLVHPTVTTKTSQEQEELSKSLEQVIRDKEVNEKKIPSNFLLSTLYNVISQSKLGLQALQNTLVKKIIIKSVKNSLMSSANTEKHRITESEIQRALNYLISSLLGTELKTEEENAADNNIWKTNTQMANSRNLEHHFANALLSHSSAEHSSELQHQLTNQRLHEHISSSIKSSKDHYHKDSPSSESKTANLDDLLDSIENKPIRYYSQTDRIADYIKKNRNKFDEYPNEDLHTTQQSPNKKGSDDYFHSSEHEIKQSSRKSHSQEKSESHISKEYASAEMHHGHKYETDSTEKFDQATMASGLSKIKQVLSLDDSSESTTSRVHRTTKTIRTVPQEDSFSGSHEDGSSVSKEHSEIDHIKSLLNSQEESETDSYYQSTVTDSRETTTGKPKFKSKIDYSKVEHSFETKEQSRESNEYHKIVKNHGIENKLFTISHENTYDYSDTSKHKSEELSTTEQVQKIRTPRTTQRSSRHNERSKKLGRPLKPSTIYEDDEFDAYSTSIAKSIESYDDGTDEFFTEVSIPSALDINKESGLKDEQFTYPNDYLIESEELSNERSRIEELSNQGSRNEGTSTTEYYDEETSYTADENVNVRKNSKVQRYTQESTDKIEKLALSNEKPKKNCDHKSTEEDVTVDATKINEEFSTTTEYTPEQSDKRHSSSRKKLYHNLHSEEQLLVKETKGLANRVVEKTTIRPVVTTFRAKSKPITQRIKNATMRSNKRDPFYIGKLVAKEKPQVFDYLNGIDLFYIGDGVRLPITVKKLPDGSFSLSLSDTICEVILKTKCVLNENDKKEANNAKRKTDRNKKNRARRSHKAFKITSADGLDLGFYDDRLLSLQKGEPDIDESRNIDDLTEKDREQVVLNALDNLKNLAQSEIDSIVNEAKEKYGEVKSSLEDKSIENS